MSSTSTVVEKASSLPKPELRGHGMKYHAKHLYIGMLLTGCFAIAFKKYVCEARQQRYKDFYENYDASKEFNRMQAIGIFKGYEK